MAQVAIQISTPPGRNYAPDPNDDKGNPPGGDAASASESEEDSDKERSFDWVSEEEDLIQKDIHKKKLKQKKKEMKTKKKSWGKKMKSGRTKKRNQRQNERTTRLRGGGDFDDEPYLVDDDDERYRNDEWHPHSHEPRHFHIHHNDVGHRHYEEHRDDKPRRERELRYRLHCLKSEYPRYHVETYGSAPSERRDWTWRWGRWWWRHDNRSEWNSYNGDDSEFEPVRRDHADVGGGRGSEIVVTWEALMVMLKIVGILCVIMILVLIRLVWI